MYNIAKVAKGEILLFFNEVFDALCKVCEISPDLENMLNYLVACSRLRTFSQEWSRTP